MSTLSMILLVGFASSIFVLLASLFYGMGKQQGRLQMQFSFWAQAYCAAKPCTGAMIHKSFCMLTGQKIGPLVAGEWLSQLEYQGVLDYNENTCEFSTTGKKVWEAA